MGMVAAEEMGGCEADSLVVALGRRQGAGRRRVSDGGAVENGRPRTFGISLLSGLPSILHPMAFITMDIGGRILMGVGEW
jgi:hypothetical protein